LDESPDSYHGFKENRYFRFSTLINDQPHYFAEYPPIDANSNAMAPGVNDLYLDPNDGLIFIDGYI